MSRIAGLLVMMWLAGIGEGQGQAGGEPSTLQPVEPEASFPHPFSRVAGLQELSEGDVLVVDGLEMAIRRLDFKAGEYRELGRIGQGPGEFRVPGALLRLPRDSTLLVDFGNMRMTVIDPAGTLASTSEPLLRGDGTFIRPQATDGTGRVYFQDTGLIRAAARGGEAGRADSAVIARWDRTGGSIDTVGWVPSRLSRMQLGGGALQGVGVAPFAVSDAWDVAADGRVAVARAHPYRLEWLLDGQLEAEGPPQDYEPIPVSRADKEAWAERISSMSVSVVASGGEGRGRSVSLPRPDIDDVDWPDVKPPFPADAVSVAPDGRAWVKRYVHAGGPATYDVFDSAGRRVRQVVLPEGRELVGFGDGVLYAVRLDENGLQWLERYRR